MGVYARGDFLDLHSPRCLWSHLSELHSPRSVSVVLVHLRIARSLVWCLWCWVHTLPGTEDLGSISPTPLRECRAAWWRGDWSCCCRRIPQSSPEGLFLFEKILLLNLAAPYKEGPVLSHSPPLQLDQGLSGLGLHTAQLSILPSQRPRSPVCLSHFILIPLPVTSSN